MRDDKALSMHETGRRRKSRENGVSLRRAVFAAFVAAAGWFCACYPFSPAHLPAAALADEGTLEETIDFYQFTDADGGVHFVDRLDKVPPRYRHGMTVRKDTPVARQSTRLRIEANRIFVPVSLTNGERKAQAILLLDTGASMTIISEDLAVRLGIDPATASPATTTVADGRTIAIRVARVDGVAVGSRLKSSIEIGILPDSGNRASHDGLLGMDFLGDFQYQIDMANGMLRWQ
jgi:clan AA aspartic protease (TIGR02281 family)